jgi:Uma2 family endonuclease
MLMVTNARRWTADDLDRLPDDGNRYEVVDGELLVTPAPRLPHQAVSAELHARLHAFVKPRHIGWAFAAPGDVHVSAANRVLPDLFVVPRTSAEMPTSWNAAPLPILVVEILSESTAFRDLGVKRALYHRAGVAEYWIVDREERNVRVSRPGEPDIVVHDRIEWWPQGTAESLTIELPALFREALDG